MIQNTSFEFSKRINCRVYPNGHKWKKEEEWTKTRGEGREGKERREGKKDSAFLKVLLEKKIQNKWIMVYLPELWQ